LNYYLKGIVFNAGCYRALVEGKTHAEAIFSSVFKDVRHRYKRGACGVTINLSTILSSLAINHSFNENVFVYLRVPCDASSRILGWEGQIRKENLKGLKVQIY
jgi:hypothetical protein